MPRTGRVLLPNYPHHIVQRGRDRQAVFAGPRDYERYLETLAEFKTLFGIRVFAYCLMTNHVHLLLAPGGETASVGRLMQRLAGRQARCRDDPGRRIGTLWESRYKSSPVESDAYLLACSRYIELNPVRARMVEDPAHYRWSSCAHHLGMANCDWLDDDPCYLSLGSDAAQRRDRYREFLCAAIPSNEWGVIREAVRRGRVTGAKPEGRLDGRGGRPRSKGDRQNSKGGQT